jgi:hypothetical protein
MKHLNKMILIAFIAITSVANYSCSKDEDDTTNNNNTPKVKVVTINFKVDGVAFQSASTKALFESDTKRMVLSASGKDQKSVMDLNFATDKGSTFTLSAANSDASIVMQVSGSVLDAYIAESGNLNITNHNTEKKIIEGTFNMVGVNANDSKDKKNFTEGKFYAEY